MFRDAYIFLFKVTRVETFNDAPEKDDPAPFVVQPEVAEDSSDDSNPPPAAGVLGRIQTFRKQRQNSTIGEAIGRTTSFGRTQSILDEHGKYPEPDPAPILQKFKEYWQDQVCGKQSVVVSGCYLVLKCQGCNCKHCNCIGVASFR